MRLNAKTLSGPKPRKNQIANLVLDRPSDAATRFSATSSDVQVTLYNFQVTAESLAFSTKSMQLTSPLQNTVQF
ncbi:hypothetical protein BS47DRAFT_1343137 [Hydnum rufescens UP504]|uniref:Uncharacterized protein n=1 Tax=Hydnum rufescens UP504 TaxID=1448309 RepID=A0A9P6B040_9AGAM|nr:hypothetical protein BS47DRAFT_1343137 [Hydnum rufescens UP504]